MKFIIPFFIILVLYDDSYSYTKLNKCHSRSEANKLVDCFQNKLKTVYTDIRKCPNCNNNTAIYDFFMANLNWTIREYEDSLIVGRCKKCNYLEILHEGIDVVNGVKGKSKNECLYQGTK